MLRWAFGQGHPRAADEGSWKGVKGKGKLWEQHGCENVFVCDNGWGPWLQLSIKLHLPSGLVLREREPWSSSWRWVKWSLKGKFRLQEVDWEKFYCGHWLEGLSLCSILTDWIIIEGKRHPNWNVGCKCNQVLSLQVPPESSCMYIMDSVENLYPQWFLQERQVQATIFVCGT